MKKTNLVLGFMLIMLMALSTGLMAVDYYVDPSGTDDGSHGSGTGSNAWKTIEYAVENVSYPTTATIVIHVAAGTYTLDNDYIYINRSFTNLTIDGEGADVTIVQAQSSSGGTGYGFYNSNSTVTIRDLTVRYCKTGIYNRGSSADLTLLNCRITENHVTDYSGGGIQNMKGYPGGSSSLTMVNCTVDNNSASSSGGGLETGETCIAKLTNCTFYGNVASGGGGIAVYRGDLYLTNCTIAGNSTSGSDYNSGGGVQMWNPSGGCDLYIKNTIIANNACGSYYSSTRADLFNYHDVYNSYPGTIHDGGYNIIEITDATSLLDGSGNYIGNQSNLWGTGNETTPSLAINNSGYGTPTLALSAGSVAINAGNISAHSGQNIPEYDQRGGNRVSTVDIGAYEYGSDTFLPVVLSTFTAQFLNNTPTLYWTTQSETDNMGWFVYRNIEEDFTTSKKISQFIEGHGTTTQQQSYLYEDRIQNPEVGDRYYYWLESIDYSGMINHYDKVAILTIPDQDDPGGGLIPEPEIYGLLQNEPNPFIESTKISFNLHKTARVELNVYNLKGQLVKTLYSGVASSKTLNWNGKDENGNELQAGVYLYKLLVNGKTAETKKLILMR